MSDHVNGANEFPTVCRDCGVPLDCQKQSDGKGGSYVIVTCWNKTCQLYSVTRSLDTYVRMSELDLQAYRDMNRNAWRPAHAVAASVSGEAGR